MGGDQERPAEGVGPAAVVGGQGQAHGHDGGRHPEQGVVAGAVRGGAGVTVDRGHDPLADTGARRWGGCLHGVILR
ncbi:hypothetical protein PBV88_52405 [Streptomyces sp. T21Q-yed]|nr:hypothetical protein [Streptomyces sp. T21Q-yed]MDF3149550.1 hypothetical protein [Streptomyces sp. T21Q-yed]